LLKNKKSAYQSETFLLSFMIDFEETEFSLKSLYFFVEKYKLKGSDIRFATKYRSDTLCSKPNSL